MIKRNPKATKERILNAAISVFSQGDFNAATMRDIARKSAVSQANIYQHYDSKESLLFSIIDTETRHMKIDLEKHLTGIKGTQNKLRKMTWFYLDFREQNRQLSWLETISLNVKAWSEAVEVWNGSMVIAGIFREILAEGKKNGEVRENADIRVAGHLYFGGLRNAISFWLLGKQFKKLAAEVADALLELAQAAVVAGETAADRPGDLLQLPGHRLRPAELAMGADD
ncbi:MAG: TetR/AcrR family transcriptional regulator, partial [Chloroflexi bacterium]|nr:TetR/AcrR family transcriptional regulator [Chloroflexota bacterium]